MFRQCELILTDCKDWCILWSHSIMLRLPRGSSENHRQCLKWYMDIVLLSLENVIYEGDLWLIHRSKLNCLELIVSSCDCIHEICNLCFRSNKTNKRWKSWRLVWYTISDQRDLSNWVSHLVFIAGKQDEDRHLFPTRARVSQATGFNLSHGLS